MKNVLACRLLPLFLLALFLPRPAHSVGNEGYEQMDFGVRAAKKGLWREALFRWERASKLLPDNARILNNLAVAYETAGEFEKAQAMYTEALRLAPDNRDIRQNHTLFEAYYKDLLARKEHDASPPPTPDSGKEPEKEPPDAPPH
ncbi:MAG TPA: tetratricopeptide repeat protein [Candidatus Polarisedimenticolia bacterium]|nr:tetratricopeptide repeat protein [Candidatus Polarisedimenticolia bacterium]